MGVLVVLTRTDGETLNELVTVVPAVHVGLLTVKKLDHHGTFNGLIHL